MSKINLSRVWRELDDYCKYGLLIEPYTKRKIRQLVEKELKGKKK